MTLPLATPGALAPESQCSGNSKLVGFCPACGDSMIPYGSFGGYAVICDSAYANVRYYADVNDANIFQCIEACQDLRECYAPVVSPDGRCLLAVIERGIEPIIASALGYAALEPRRFGSFTSGTLKSSTQRGLGDVTPGTTHRSLATHTTKHSPTCQASEIACPHCNGAFIEDPSGRIYEILCNSQLWSEEYYSIQEWLTPEGCMAECDRYRWCKGSNFRPEGNCELARGQDAFPQYRSGYTAFLPGNTKTPTPSLRAFPSASPTTKTASVHHTARPIPAKCNHRHPKCPECSDVELSDGWNQTYCVRCDLRPICAVVQGRREHVTPNACMEQCDRDRDCQAAIFDRGQCELCRGSIESLTPWVLPHEYVVFIAEEALKTVSASSLSTSFTSPHPGSGSLTTMETAISMG